MSQEIQQNDPLTTLYADVASQRERLARIADPSPKKVLAELTDTGLSVTQDLVAYVLQLRQYIAETFEDIDGRLGSLEEGEAQQTLIDPDAAQMILSLAGMCEGFVNMIRESSASITPEASKSLDEALQLVENVRAWVSENLGDEEDVSEDDAEEDASDNADA